MPCAPFTPGSSSSSVTVVAVITFPTGGGSDTDDLAFTGTTIQTQTTPLGSGDTATIGFWHNKNGQGLIDSLNGGSTATGLATWLATTFPKLYGQSPNNVTGDNNAQVASLFLTLFGAGGQKTQAQILATALACYSTSTTLSGGTGATKYGFNMTPAGTCSDTFNIGSDGTAVGLTNNTSYTILQLLQRANTDTPFSSAVANAFNDIFSNINQNGDIN